VITLFGKQMPLEPEAEGRSRREDYQGYDGSGERRVFWLVAILFLGVLAAVAAGVYYLAAPRSRPTTTGGPSTVGEAVTAKPAAPGSAEQAGTQAKAASEPAAAPAPPPVKAAPQSAGTAASRPPAAAPKKATATARRGRLAARQAARARALARAAAAADRTASPQKEYLQRLRQQQEQYERDKARGKYQEFPK
jgi:type IV secretory pathway VirB10-like protein